MVANIFSKFALDVIMDVLSMATQGTEHYLTDHAAVRKKPDNIKESIPYI